MTLKRFIKPTIFGIEGGAAAVEQALPLVYDELQKLAAAISRIPAVDSKSASSVIGTSDRSAST